MEFNATFLVSIISFVLFTLVMNKIFYQPVGNIINERKNFIDNMLVDAINLSKEADILLNEREEKLNNSILESKKFISEEVDKTNKIISTHIKNEKLISKEEIEKNKNRLQSEFTDMDKVLNEEANKIAKVITAKILGKKLDIEDKV